MTMQKPPTHRAGNTDLSTSSTPSLPFYLKHEQRASHVERTQGSAGRWKRDSFGLFHLSLTPATSAPGESILPTVLLTYVAPNARAWAQHVCFGPGIVWCWKARVGGSMVAEEYQISVEIPT